MSARPSWADAVEEEEEQQKGENEAPVGGRSSISTAREEEQRALGMLRVGIPLRTVAGKTGALSTLVPPRHPEGMPV